MIDMKLKVTTKEAGEILGLTHRSAQTAMQKAGLNPTSDPDKGTREKYLWYTVEVYRLRNSRTGEDRFIAQSDIDAMEADKKRKTPNSLPRGVKLRMMVNKWKAENERT